MIHHKTPEGFVGGPQAGHSSLSLASTAKTAPKPTSTAVSPSSPPKRKSWLAGLVIGAVTAGVVVSGLEQAPITGRRQLLLQSPFLPSFTRLQQTDPSPMPTIYKIGYEVQKKSLEFIAPQAMQQLLEITYTRLAAAVEKLAESSPDLDRHLARMPNKVVLSGGCSLKSMCPLLQISKQAPLMLRMQAVDTLPLQSTDELLSAMCRGLAAAVLDHQREVDSWKLVNNIMLCSNIYAQRAGGVRWRLALALPAALWLVANSVIRIWFPRQQEYEADEVAAAFSKAAGCSRDSILTSMQRAYCAAITEPYAAAMKVASDRNRRQFLSLLRQVLPSVVILQDSVLDDAEVQRLKSDVLKKLPGSLIGELSRALDYCQITDLWAIRNPVEAWTSPHPHWLDRIARMEKLLGSNGLACFADQARPPSHVRPGFASHNRYAAGL